MKYIAVALAIMLILYSISLLLLGKKWRHDQLGWGYPIAHTGGDDFQPIYRCEFCHLNLAQDSNGDYFHLSSSNNL